MPWASHWWQSGVAGCNDCLGVASVGGRPAAAADCCEDYTPIALAPLSSAQRACLGGCMAADCRAIEQAGDDCLLGCSDPSNACGTSPSAVCYGQPEALPSKRLSARS